MNKKHRKAVHTLNLNTGSKLCFIKLIIWPIKEAERSFPLCCCTLHIAYRQTFSHVSGRAISERLPANADLFPHMKCENSDVIDENS
jgi:hypothetical protein